ncbi:cellulose biosynthesis protein BcsR [Pseudomonas sp. TWR3-1-1]|uniref:cellulose biosynthesis protein BcsR n=1 Tax=Pseudomonas sp. TWR3-1-1 TaxID=2804633 RepID=UPI003CE73F37
MAALPTAFQISADILSRTERADDIARLKSMMDLPTLGYVDVSAQMELMQALERWPLLAHLEAQRLTLPADNPALTLQTHPETTR